MGFFSLSIKAAITYPNSLHPYEIQTLVTRSRPTNKLLLDMSTVPYLSSHAQSMPINQQPNRQLCYPVKDGRGWQRIVGVALVHRVKAQTEIPQRLEVVEEDGGTKAPITEAKGRPQEGEDGLLALRSGGQEGSQPDQNSGGGQITGGEDGLTLHPVEVVPVAFFPCQFIGGVFSCYLYPTERHFSIAKIRFFVYRHLPDCPIARLPDSYYPMMTNIS